MTQGNSPKGILLDLDNTLYEYRPCHDHALGDCCLLFAQRTGLTAICFEETYNRCRKQIHAELHGVAASHNRLLYIQRTLEAVGLPLHSGLMLELYHHYWDAFLDKAVLGHGVLDFLAFCRVKGIKIALTTDLTADVQLKKVQYFALETYLDAIITSEEAGQEKPASRIFELALKKIGLSADNVWVVGDSVDKDILGGNRIGATTIHFSGYGDDAAEAAEDMMPDFSINSFVDLLGLLRERIVHCG